MILRQSPIVFLKAVVALGQVPCLTVRESTERPSTTEMGTNELVPLDPGLISDRVTRILADGCPSGQVPPLWDGDVAHRTVQVLEKELAS